MTANAVTEIYHDMTRNDVLFCTIYLYQNQLFTDFTDIKENHFIGGC